MLFVNGEFVLLLLYFEDMLVAGCSMVVANRLKQHFVYSMFFDNGEFVLLLLYFEDMLVAGCSMVVVYKLKQQLSKNFSMKDSGVVKKILKIKMMRDMKKKEHT
jgi:hypothetical protein